MQYIEIPSVKEIRHKSVFLAGDNESLNWQASLVMYMLRADLDITVINSKSVSNNLIPFSNRIKWESNMLSVADIVVFWITDSANPNKLWTDYGMALEFCRNKNKKMIAGINKGVKNIDCIIGHTEMINSKVCVYRRWNMFVESVLKASQYVIDSSRDLTLDGFEILQDYDDEPRIWSDKMDKPPEKLPKSPDASIYYDEGHEPEVYTPEVYTNDGDLDQPF